MLVPGQKTTNRRRAQPDPPPENRRPQRPPSCTPNPPPVPDPHARRASKSHHQPAPCRHRGRNPQPSTHARGPANGLRGGGPRRRGGVVVKHAAPQRDHGTSPDTSPAAHAAPTPPPGYPGACNNTHTYPGEPAHLHTRPRDRAGRAPEDRSRGRAPPSPQSGAAPTPRMNAPNQYPPHAKRTSGRFGEQTATPTPPCANCQSGDRRSDSAHSDQQDLGKQPYVQ